MELVWRTYKPFGRRLYAQVETMELSELTNLAQTTTRDPTMWRRMGRRVQKLWAKDDCSAEECLVFMESAASKGYTDAELMYNFGALSSKFDASQASRALKVHADVRFSNPPAFKELKAALDGASPDAVLRAAWSLCSLAHRGAHDDPPLDLLQSIPVDALSATNIVRFVDAHYLIQHAEQARLRDAVKQLNLNDISVEDISHLAKSFAKLRVNSESFFTAIAECLQEPSKLPALSGAQLVDLVYGFAKFGHKGTQHGILFDLIATEARKKLHTMTISQISQLLSSFARAHISSKVLVNRAISRLNDRTEWWLDTSFTDIVNLSMAFGKFQVHDQGLLESLSSGFMYHFSEGPRDPSTFLTRDILNIIHAFAKVHLRPPENLLSVITRELQSRIDQLEISDVVKYLHAAGKIQLSGELSSLMVDKLDKTAMMSLSVFDALKVHLALQKLDGIESTAIDSHLAEVLPVDLRTQRQAWTSQRKPIQGIRRRKSARKRKWTW